MNAYAFDNFERVEERRYQDSLDSNAATAEQIARSEKHWREWIDVTLRLNMANPARAIPLPWVSSTGFDGGLNGQMNIKRMSHTEAVYDVLDNASVMARLTAILQCSSCPLVAQLRDEIVAKYQDDWAELIAQAEAEQ